ncbi:hypothetical protein ACH5RR_001583 [Cinchona calisaya]|uniref:Aminotransferase-like plant mobile domain-containing protein n=1 Tax=Cinchona calisaya TaxID=153742 RepID=A0ABD3B3T6_9GENT
MTQGQIYDLATPVLARLYRQLGHISYAKKLGQLLVRGPFQYLFGWLAIYIPRTYSRRDFLHPNAPLLSLIRDSSPARFTYNTTLQLFRNFIEFSFRPYVNFSEGRDLKDIALKMSTLNVEMAYLLLRCFSIGKEYIVIIPGLVLSLALLMSRPVEDGSIRSVEFPSDESSSQHGPTTFGSLDDLESFMSFLPSTKDIYNLFDSSVFIKGSGILQTKRNIKGKETFHLEDETDDELFDYTFLSDGAPDSTTPQQG